MGGYYINSMEWPVLLGLMQRTHFLISGNFLLFSCRIAPSREVETTEKTCSTFIESKVDFIVRMRIEGNYWLNYWFLKQNIRISMEIFKIIIPTGNSRITYVLISTSFSFQPPSQWTERLRGLKWNTLNPKETAKRNICDHIIRQVYGTPCF